jgi:hypothetical protein
VSERVRTWVLAAWAAAVVGVLALNVLWPLPGQDRNWPWVMGLMAFPIAAALVLARRRGNTVGRLLGVVGMSGGAIFVLSWYAVTFPDGPLSRELEAVEMIPAVLQFGGILALLHLFPTGRPANRLHAWVVAALWSYVALFSALGVVRPGPMPITGRTNPFGLGDRWVGGVFEAGIAGIGVFGALGFLAVVARWRRAGPVERAQLKWFFAGAGWLTFVLVVISFFPGDFTDPLVQQLSYAVAMVAFWSLPIAVVIAITRYRLFDIDRIISRTVTYAVVAGILGLVYAGSVVGLQTIIPVGGSDLAVAGSTLAVAALFRPVIVRVRRAVDRRFNRARYEVGLVTQAFAARVRREVDLATVIDDLRAVVDTTMRPASVDLWLRATPPRAEASGRLSPARASSRSDLAGGP